jgi:flavin-dependent dehydrogenase
LLLERALLPRSRICGEYLCPGAVAALLRCGFGPAIRAARAAPLLGVRLFAPSGREVPTRFPEAPGLSVRRCEFDGLLVDACGADVRRGAHVVALRREGAVTAVRLTDGSEVRASVVVGADGRNGVVARESGLRLGSRSRRAAVHGYYVGVRGTGAFGEMHLPGDGSYFGLNPGPDGCVNVTWVTDLDRLPGDVRRNARELLAAALRACPSLQDRFRDAEPREDPSVLAPLEVRTRGVAADGVVLAGDAAGFLDPLTGEGIYGALVSGTLAGEAAARAARGGGAGATRGYVRSYRRALGRKRALNRLFQWMLRRPRLLEFLGGRLGRSRELADALIAVIGNARAPGTLLAPRHLLALAGLHG